MNKLTSEQLSFAISLLVRTMENRDIKQTALALLTGIKQPTISKYINREISPSIEHLELLFDKLGLRLANVLADRDAGKQELRGYLATPLTGLTANADAEVRNVVAQLKQIAQIARSNDLPFELYWPGDHTHPMTHSSVTAKDVYLVDRSRAATYDFIVLFCASPSYGVGQENEIACQACTPAIRLVPKQGLSQLDKHLLQSSLQGAQIGLQDCRRLNGLQERGLGH